MNLGSRIRQFRNAAGLSQEKLAWQAGIAPAFLGQLERGLKSPTVKTLEKLTRALGISIAELFSGPADLSDEKDAAIKQIVYQIRDLPVESIQNISVMPKKRAPPKHRRKSPQKKPSPTLLLPIRRNKRNWIRLERGGFFLSPIPEAAKKYPPPALRREGDSYFHSRSFYFLPPR